MQHKNRTPAFIMACLRRVAAGLLVLGLAAPALAAEAADERTTLAQTYFRVSGFEAMYSDPDKLVAMVNAQMQAVEANLAAQMTPAQLEDYRRQMAALAPDLRRIIGTAVRRMSPDMVAALARTYSVEELKSLIAYYDSATGRAIVAKNDVLMQEIGQVSGHHMATMMQDLQRLMVAPARPAAKSPAKGK